MTRQERWQLATMKEPKKNCKWCNGTGIAVIMGIEFICVRAATDVTELMHKQLEKAEDELKGRA